MAVDEPAFLQGLASQYGFTMSDLEAARAALNLPPGEFPIRFTFLVVFANTFGVNVKALADFVAKTTSGIEPWPRQDRPLPGALTSEERARVKEVVPDGDRAHAILRLLDRLEHQREQS